ncbi:hypothetical protein GCM10023093_10850 [Nemorincola caseinilytica]|uniref:Uncharacterized protein n=1 Tax=Nemorincola caseinilytica TaxID=2054315 RepID=A0ABP8NC30_9BACT
MAYKRKTWKEKLAAGDGPKVERLEKKFADIPEGATMLVATPAIVDAYVRNIPRGTHTGILQMRKDLAAEHNAEYTCPLTAGIFLRIVAEAAWEAYNEGKPLKQITPFWRMMDAKAPVCKKLTFDTEFIKEQREKEGLPF